MADPLQYYAQFQSARGGFGRLPSWARGIVALLALPGVVLVLLSLLALGISIPGLLLLTVPVYRLLQGLTGSTGPAVRAEAGATLSSLFVQVPRDSPGRRQVDARVIDTD